jgi:hypothetical protein
MNTLALPDHFALLDQKEIPPVLTGSPVSFPTWGYINSDIPALQLRV